MPENTSMTKKQLQELYMDYLKTQGYKGEVDKEGDVRFKREGGGYFLQVSEDDEQYFRIVYPNFWAVKDEQARVQVVSACERANATVKVAKVFIVENRVWASVELLFGDPRGFEPVFERALSTLRAVVKRFGDKMSDQG